MTTLVMVGYTGGQPWPRSQQRVLLDRDTGQHYLVVTTKSPWNNDSLTRVYATDSFGRIISAERALEGTPRMACGGWYSMNDGIGDLTQRLRTGNILTQQESDALDAAMIERDTEAFRSYIQPTMTT